MTLWLGPASCGFALDFPLLRLSKGGNHVLLIGSQHIGEANSSRAKDIEDLLKTSSSVCMETDPGDTQTTIRIARTVFGNPNGKRLKDRIGSELYNMSKDHLGWYLATGASIDDVSPYALSSLLTMNIPELRRFMSKAKPQNSLDADIQRALARLGQPIKTIEDKNAVSAAFATLSDDEWRYLVLGTLNMLHCKECAENYADSMIHAYDATTDFESAHQSAEKAFSNDLKMLAIFQKLYYVKRNKEMAENIEHDALMGGKCSIIAVGAGHLGGAFGVVALLRNKDVEIESVSYIFDALNRAR